MVKDLSDSFETTLTKGHSVSESVKSSQLVSESVIISQVIIYSPIKNEQK